MPHPAEPRRAGIRCGAQPQAVNRRRPARAEPRGPPSLGSHVLVLAAEPARAHGAGRVADHRRAARGRRGGARSRTSRSGPASPTTPSAPSTASRSSASAATTSRRRPSEDVPDAGHLNMTTISVIEKVPLFGALGMWATGRYALAPREEYFPPDKTVEEVQRAGRAGVPGLAVVRRDRRAALPRLPEGGLRRRDPGRLAERRRAGAAGPDRRGRRHAGHGLRLAAGRARQTHAGPDGGTSPCCARASEPVEREGDPRRQPGGRRPGVPGHRRGGAAGGAVHHLDRAGRTSAARRPD